METTKMKTFLLNHTSMYELISMDNSKYLIWKLTFPRVGDSFVTVDKLLDMCSWEKLYNILKRITIQYSVTSQLSTTSVSVQCCEFWYQLTIQRIPMDNQCVHDFCGVDVDSNLLHDEILCANIVYNNDNPEKSLIAQETSSCSSRFTTPMNRKRTYSVSQITDNNQLTQRRMPSTPRRRLVTSSPQNNVSPNPDCSTDEPTGSMQSRSEESIVLRYDHNSESDKNDSCSEEENLLGFSALSESWRSTNHQSPHLEEVMSQNTKSKMNLELMWELLKDPQYLNDFCYEKDQPTDSTNRTFDIYSVNGKISYAAFHSPYMLRHLEDRSNLKLFFYYSNDMLFQLNSTNEMQFEGINHVLMVFVNHFSDKVRPFAYILLPYKDPAIIGNMIEVIDGWLNVADSNSTVTKCVIPHDNDLHEAIAETWPEAKVIGCSAEYQNRVKLFAKLHKGLTIPHVGLTRLAYGLCYLPDTLIAKGIEIIEKRHQSEYGKKLGQYLRTNWTDHPISIDGENIVYRSLIVCKRYEYNIIRNRFCGNSSHPAIVLKNCWDFIEFLKSESKFNSVEMRLDSTKVARSKLKFGLNTKLQKEREERVVKARKSLTVNLEAMPSDDAVTQFLQQMVRCM